MRRGYLTIEQVAKKIRRSNGRTKNLSTNPDFPPPRERGPYRRKYYAPEDINYWLRTRVDGRKNKTRRNRRGK
jgi:hypothetical protein